MKFKLYALMGLLLLTTVSGVYANWKYPLRQPTIEMQVPIQIIDFFWAGAEDLPEDDSVGENHIALIERLTISEYGMNDPDSFLSQYISDRIQDSKDTVSSVAPTPGGNLKDLFNTSEMRQLSFMIKLNLSNDDQIIGCEIYTFQTSSLSSSVGREVSPVYKTTMKLEDGKWLPERTYEGKSVTMKYDAKQGGGRITVNPDEWEET